VSAVESGLTSDVGLKRQRGEPGCILTRPSRPRHFRSSHSTFSALIDLEPKRTTRIFPTALACFSHRTRSHFLHLGCTSKSHVASLTFSPKLSPIFTLCYVSFNTTSGIASLVLVGKNFCQLIIAESVRILSTLPIKLPFCTF
jgi:hypothetical protein